MSANRPGEKTRALVIQVEAWAQEEVAAQERMLCILAGQEDAVARNHTEDLIEAGAAVEAELATGSRRGQKRALLVASLAGQWGVPAPALTLGSIAERAAREGLDTVRLERLRAELRDSCACVLRKGRRIAAMARYHQGFLNELVRLIAGGTGDQEALSLVDARG